MNKLIQRSLAVLTVPFAMALHAAELPSPLVAVDLYLKAMVNHDESSIRQLNDYLRADRLHYGLSANYANVAAQVKADQDYASKAAQMVRRFYPAAMPPELEEPLTALMATVQQARQKSVCQALSAAEPQADEHEVLTADVRFECSLVKVPEPWAIGINRLAQNPASLADTRAGLKQLQDSYAVPLNFTYQGSFSVSIVPRDNNEAWRTDSAQDVIEAMFDGL